MFSGQTIIKGGTNTSTSTVSGGIVKIFSESEYQFVELIVGKQLRIGSKW
jgi:hypothetical protein